MPLTITHSTPADGTFSATGATAWNANHSFTVSGTSGELQYNSGGDLAGMSGTSWNDTTRSLTLTGATVTASAPVLDLTQTWNNAAVTFTGLRANFTDTASAAGSLLFQLQRGGVNQFTVSRSGIVTGPTSATFELASSTGQNIALNPGAGGGVFLYSNNISIAQNSANFGWLDVPLTRRAAANLRFGAADAAAPVAQTLSVQSVVAGTTNTAGANLTITGSQGTGTGAGGSIIFQVAPAGSSGTAQNALADVLTLSGSTRGAIFHPGAFQSGGISFSGSTANIYSRSVGVINISQANTLAVEINYPVVKLSSDYVFAWSNTAGVTGASGVTDLILARDAANTLALRNGTNAQTFNVYNTYTDASNYERASIRWASNVLTIGPQVLGTGVARSVSFTDGGGTERINIAATSGVVLVADMQLITASSISYIGAASSGFTFRYTSGSNSNMMVRFTGITSSFPALKRSTTSLQVRLADDSAFTNIQGKLTTETNYTAGTIIPDGYLVLYDATGTAYKVPCVAL